jgi:hypothetical protein
VQEYSPDNDDLQEFLISALQAELDNLDSVARATYIISAKPNPA